MIITSDSELRRYIPNAFDTVEGENTLYEKLTPFLESAEDWFTRELFPIYQFIGQSDHEYVHSRYLAPIVAHEAFRNAIPSLDVVLTSNGFGIINNQNVVPASKERIERLIATLKSNRDTFIANYLTYLDLQDYWKSSGYFSKFHQTIFPSLSIAKDCVDLFDGWKKRTPHFVAIETELAQRYISPELYDQLRTVDESTASVSVIHFLSSLRFIELSKHLGDNVASQRDIERLVSILKNSSDEFFACWKTSETAKLFLDHSFKNQKKSGGFWLR